MHQIPPATSSDNGGVSEPALDGPGADILPFRPRAIELVEEATESAREFLGQAKAANTLRAYRSDWRDFVAWCAERELEPLPATPQTVALYAADSAARVKANTISRRLSSISQAHKAADLPSPVGHHLVRTTMSGIRRAIGTAQKGKAPLLTEDLRAVVDAMPSTLAGARDRALLLLGFAAAVRRSELVALDVGDVEDTNDGLVVTIRRSKTDQEGEGRKVGVPYGSTPATCPVRAVRAWLQASAISDGALFRAIAPSGVGDRLSDRSVALIVKRRVEAAGLDPRRFAGHSLRAGLATSAARGGATERAIMAQTGHKSLAVMRRYIRDGTLFSENAAAKTGL